MIDLSAPEMQATFKKLQRVSLVTNILMCVVAVACVTIAIWLSVIMRGYVDWAVILFYILLALIPAYLVFILVWEFKVRRGYRETMRRYVAEGFKKCKLLQGGRTSEVELSLAGDKLVVMRSGRGEYVQFDLSPVQSYTSVCAYITRCVKNYVCDYYYLAAKRGEVDEAKLVNNIQGKGKVHLFVEGGNPLKDRSKSYYVVTSSEQ